MHGIFGTEVYPVNHINRINQVQILKHGFRG